MELKVYKTDGSESTKSVTLNDRIFNVEPNDHAIWLDVKQYLANQRQGTHDTLEKSTVSGSTRKLKRQKGTGGARAGSIKSGTRIGGGRIFGPRPRNYHFKLNIKLKRLARKSAFAYKAKQDALIVLEDVNFGTAKTKDFKALVSGLKLDNEKVLFIVGNDSENVYLSSRNLERVKVVSAESFNTYDVLNAKKVVLATSSIEVIEKILN